MPFPGRQPALRALLPQILPFLTVSVLMLLSRALSLMATAQLVCPEVATLRAKSSLHFSTQQVEGQHLLGDISTGTFRPVVVPATFKQQVFDTIHGIVHPGTLASMQIASSSPGMYGNVPPLMWPTWPMHTSPANKVRSSGTSTGGPSTSQCLPDGSATCTWICGPPACL